MDNNKNYLRFASSISFFEFIQEEFRKPSFNISSYLDEIKELSKKSRWKINELSEFLRKHPKSFEIFENVFQLLRFTNAQLIHFLFDITTLNKLDNVKLINYLKYNLKFDRLFEKIFLNESAKMDLNFRTTEDIFKFIDNKIDEELCNLLIFLLKITIINYIHLSIKDIKVIHDRIANENFKDVSERIATYLIKNLHFNEILRGIKIKEFLENKRVPIDTKSIHGNFGRIKISQILKNHGFIDADDIFNKHKIKTLNKDLRGINILKNLRNKFVFVTEKYVEGILKRKDKKPKKFDFILLFDLMPKVVIETNFYSTVGTKIGINQGEYVDLNEDIKNECPDLTFIWITDGNYWLTPDGKSRLLNLYNYFSEDTLLNYNLFDNQLEFIKRKMRGK